nr:hypothetical protein [Halorubrum sp. Ea1]
MTNAGVEGTGEATDAVGVDRPMWIS